MSRYGVLSVRNDWKPCIECYQLYFRIDTVREDDDVCDWCHYIGDEQNYQKLEHEEYKEPRKTASYVYENKKLPVGITKTEKGYKVHRFKVGYTFSTQRDPKGARRLAGILNERFRNSFNKEEALLAREDFLLKHPECITRALFFPKGVSFSFMGKHPRGYYGRFRVYIPSHKIAKGVWVKTVQDVKTKILEAKKYLEVCEQIKKEELQGKVFGSLEIKRRLGMRGKTLPRGIKKEGNGYSINIHGKKTDGTSGRIVYAYIPRNLFESEESAGMQLEDIREYALEFRKTEDIQAYIDYRYTLIRFQFYQRQIKQDHKKMNLWHKKNADDSIDSGI